MVSITGAAVEELLVRQTRSFPLALFQLLASPEKAHELQNRRRCCRDSFTDAFMLAFPGESLSSAESLATLELISRVGHTDTVGLEWSHGSVQKLINAQKQQSNTPTMQYVNAQWVARRYAFRQAQSLSKLVLAPLRRKQQFASGDRPPKRAKLMRSGGAMRAYISMRSRGQKTKASFKELAAQFRADKAAGHERYFQARREGSAATTVHRLTRLKPFGKPIRDIRRKEVSRQRVASTRPTPPAAQQEGEDRALLAAPNLVTASGAALEEELTSIRSRKLQEGRKKLEAKQVELSIIRSFLEAHSDQAVADLLSAVPALAEVSQLPESLSVQPSRSQLSFEVAWNSLACASELATWSQKNSRKSNLRNVLLKDWELKNSVIMDSQLTDDNLKKRQPLRRCLVLGQCVCSSNGQLLDSFHKQFLRNLQSTFPTKQDRGQPLLTWPERRLHC